MSKMTMCKSCSKEIAHKAKHCPSCGAKNRKPIYKKVWFWVVALFVVFATTIGGNSENSTASNGETASNNTEATNTNTTEETTETSIPKEEPAEKVDATIPSEYKSALRKAKTYSNSMHMSKISVYDQLTSEYGEKFTQEAAQYAMDNLEADWNANALGKAKTYSDTMSMSKAGIYDQLVSEHGEKFTPEEAQYAIDNLEANWNENALKKAKTYQEAMAMSPSSIYDQLTSQYGEKFTPEEAQYAIDNLN